MSDPYIYEPGTRRVRSTDPNDAELAWLEANGKLETFANLIDAARKVEKLEDEQREIEKSRAALRAKSAETVKAMNKDYPPTTFMDNWRRDVKGRV